MAAGHDPNDDCSRALVAAARWSAENDAVVTFSGRYRLVDCATITNRASFHFDNAIFDVYGRGGIGTLSNGARGRIGILFQHADDLRLSGDVPYRGDGMAGATCLAGLVFAHCNRARAKASGRYDNLAVGCSVSWWAAGLLGDVQ